MSLWRANDKKAHGAPSLLERCPVRGDGFKSNQFLLRSPSHDNRLYNETNCEEEVISIEQTERCVSATLSWRSRSGTQTDCIKLITTRVHTSRTPLRPATHRAA